MIAAPQATTMNRCHAKTSCARLVVTILSVSLLGTTAAGRTQLKNICRIKGQEENVLRGQGLVVGLNGTGEAGDGQTMRAIARAMEIMGSPMAVNSRQGGLDELKKIKNAALVWVEATVPATGARRGDKLTCYVMALNGKSLEGGRLAFAALQGPNTQDKRVYALCKGQVTVDNPEVPTVGVISGGCQMEADIFTPFFKDGYITLVLDSNHADFYTANVIAETINSQYQESLNYSRSGGRSIEEDLCQARDATNIQVRIPEAFRNDPVGFAAEILDTKLYEHEPEARVVINPRAGSIVISGDVEIGDVIVSHKNVVVEATASPQFTPIDVDQANDPKLKALVDQLNSLKVPTADIIDIIRGIDRNGKMHARLIIE
jgi:flagellar P-ring protein precursor FlgI